MTFYDEFGQSLDVDVTRDDSPALMSDIVAAPEDEDFGAMLDRLLADILGPQRDPEGAWSNANGIPVLIAAEDADDHRRDTLEALHGLVSELVGERYSVIDSLGGAIELRVVPFGDGSCGWFAVDKATQGSQFLMISDHADYPEPFAAMDEAIAAIDRTVRALDLHAGD